MLLNYYNSLFLVQYFFAERLTLFFSLDQVVAAMCSKVPFLSNAIMKATECGR
jgi:hypothetical protein